MARLTLIHRRRRPNAARATRAALIIVGALLVLVATGVPSIQQVGLGGAVAIAAEATIVRLVVVPATMKLLGASSWWLPRQTLCSAATARADALGRAISTISRQGWRTS